LKDFFAHFDNSQLVIGWIVKQLQAVPAARHCNQGRRTMSKSGTVTAIDPKQSSRIEKLQEELNALSGGESIFKASPECPPDILESSLEDIVAFESVGSGTSLFEGLQNHGLDLPRPDKLNEAQSAKKAMEIFKALAELQIFLIGFDDMSARELYSTLFSQTLWEGCYVKKRHSGAVTLIDISRKMKRSEIQKYLEEMMKAGTVH
jgi:hypothetical protein